MLRDKEMWKKARNSEEYGVLRERLLNEYNEWCAGKDIPMIKFSDELEFFKTGNRSIFEKKYFDRRRQLSIYVTMAMLYPEKKEYLEKAEDIICEICNEYSWQLPAHRRADWMNKRDDIDLFAAETGMYLAEIKYMLIERLNPLVIERITNEIRWRILDSFEKQKFWFEGLKSNWAAVCGAGVGISFIYESPERFIGIRDRIDKCMANYLDGICDEGSTSEGISYWVYGFSFFVMYNEVLRRHTYGRTDKFKDEKVKRLASFFSSVMLDDNIFVSFSDASAKADMPVWLLHFLKREYDIDILPAEKCKTGLSGVSGVLRDFVYYIPDARGEALTFNKTTHYKELQWYISKTKQYGFAAKGGNNGEEHNHNDVGSFIVVNNGRQVLCDLGAAKYTAQYFGPERYSFLNASSLGHSVPVVEGKEQGTGKEFSGELSVCDNLITVDMKNAYPGDFEKLQRTFELSENSVVLTDSFSKGLNITERFVTEIEPVFENGSVIIDKTRIFCPKNWNVNCECQYITKNSESAEIKAYLIDFTPDAETDLFSLKISFSE